MASTAVHPDHVTAVNRLEIHYATGTVYVRAKLVNLSTIEHALLFSIARHRHASTRDQLIDLVWNEEVNEHTINAFNVALHRLRRRLGGADAIVYGTSGYALCADAVVDLENLEALARVSRRSAPLGDRELQSLQRAYESWRSAATFVTDRYEWLEATSRRTQALFAEVGLAFGRNVLQRGDVSKALEVAHDLLDADGCDEQAAELVISALIGRGERSEALRVYRQYAATLMGELGLRPSQRVTMLLA